jgi:hypothetical protein
MSRRPRTGSEAEGVKVIAIPDIRLPDRHHIFARAVTSIDGGAASDGRPGPLSRALGERHAAHMAAAGAGRG